MRAGSQHQAFRRMLAERGYRVTPQRVAIYDAIHGDPSHPSADDVYQRVRRRYPMISPATVYKTLELFVRLGLVSELGFGDDVNRYDSNPEAHVNCVCVRCRKITDVDDAAMLAAVRRRAADASRFEIFTGRHEFYGLCPECRAAEATRA